MDFNFTRLRSIFAPIAIALAVVVSSLPYRAAGATSDDAQIVKLALDILETTLKCSVSPTIVSNEDDGAFEIVDKITKSFSGDDANLEVTGINARHYFDRLAAGVTITNRTFSYHVPFALLDEAKVDDATIELSCSSGQPCIDHSLSAPECSFALVEQGGCNGPPISTSNQIQQMSLTLCSPAAAQQFEMAFDTLQRRAKPLTPVSVNTWSPDDPANLGPAKNETRYRVVDDVSGGILNLRAGPTTRDHVIVEIPRGAADIDVDVQSCKRTGSGSKPWCRASWHGNTGWLSQCCVVNAKTGKFP